MNAMPGKQLDGGSLRRLAAPLIAAVALRLALLAAALVRGGSAALIQPDTASYLRPGRNLLLHAQFVSGGLPELVRTPGYALFLALFSLACPLAVALAQIALSAASLLLVSRIARAACGDERTELAAAWIFAFEPLSVVYSVLLLSETLFLALFLLGLERLVAFLRARRLPVLAAAGLSLAAATYVRPVTYYLPLALALGLFAVLARVPGLLPGLRWKAPAVLLLTTMPLLATWQLRNSVETGFAGFSSIQPLDLYFFSAAEVTARLEHRTLAAVDDELGYNSEADFFARHPEAASWTEAQRLLFMRSSAVRILRSHPYLFMRTHAAGMLRTAFNPGAAVFVSLLGAPLDRATFARERDEGPLTAAWSTAKQSPFQAAVMAAFAAVLFTLYGLALRGVLLGRLPSIYLLLLIGIALYFAAVSGGAIGAARLRLPIMPELCILAAAGMQRRRHAQLPAQAPASPPAMI
jgi:hypothetical protein